LKTIRFDCPVCKKNRTKDIPIEELKEKTSGLFSILVNPDEECPHTLLTLLDRNHVVRGVNVLDFSVSTAKPEEKKEIILQKKISIQGAYKIFEEILIDMISCILQNKSLVLCGDIDTSIMLFGVINRIFPEIHSLGEKVVISEDSSEKLPNSFVINTQLKVIESGKILKDANSIIKDYVNEAVKMGEDEAAIIYLRQKFSVLLKVADFLEKNLKEKTSEKNVIKNIQTDMRIKINTNELYAVCLILSGRGKEDIVKSITMSKIDKF
jgi:hypothetical protein